MLKKTDSSIANLKTLDSFVAYKGHGVQFNEQVVGLKTTN